MRLREIQDALKDEGLDGWLFFDHHRRDPLAYRVLEFTPGSPVTRRWYYFVPAQGEPSALSHRIEAETLKDLPGTQITYSDWGALEKGLQKMLNGARRVAMQFSPECAVPTVAMVDAGTVDLVRRLGAEVVTAANLIQHFESRWTQAQRDMHFEAGRRVDRVRAQAFQRIGEKQRVGDRVTEWDIQQFIRQRYREEGLLIDHGPDVAVNANASNPHYDPKQDSCSEIRKGDRVLIDMWGKLDQPDSVYYDITWMGYCGEMPPDTFQNVFGVVREARDRAIKRVTDAIASGETLRGFQVDDACRGHIREKGYGEYFFHRTGHSIGCEVHGTGANMDNLETHDERKIIPGTCFSIEPGIYLPEFGVRTEINMFIGEKQAQVTGEIQKEIVRIV